MIVSAQTLKWVMRFYPPLLFQRIWVKSIAKDFKHVQVKIFRSIFNINYNKSIFGGTIFSATDPFYAVCLFQVLKRKGKNVQVWVKSAEIRFLKPGFTSLHFSLSLDDLETEKICNELDHSGKCSKVFPLEVFNDQEELCALVNTEVHVRKLNV